MNKLRLSVLVFALILLLSATGLGLADTSRFAEDDGATNPYAVANAPWYVKTVESTDSVGAHTSIVFDPGSGRPYISYYDATNKDLRMANRTPSDGNCGPDDTWYCQSVDSEDDVGEYNSIAVFRSGSSWKVGIAYYDATNFALKYAVRTCNIFCIWSISTIVQSFDALNAVGQHASLAFDSTGAAHISYHRIYQFDVDELNYAHYVGSGGNCGVGNAAGKWQCEKVDTGEGMGLFTSLDVNGSDKPRIAYYDAANGDLRYAFGGAVGGNCGTGGSWQCGTVDGDTGDNVGKYASLHIDKGASDNPSIAYYDATNGKLKYAEIPGSDANCGYLFWGVQIWRCEDIDDIGVNLISADLALTVDAAGYPIIAYEDASEDLAPAVLKVARPASALGLFVGNCGPTPPGWMFVSWWCEKLDGGDNQYLHEGAYASIAVNPTGLAAIAYSEHDDYNGGYNLKIAFQQLQTFLPVITR